MGGGEEREGKGGRGEFHFADLVLRKATLRSPVSHLAIVHSTSEAIYKTPVISASQSILFN